MFNTHYTFFSTFKWRMTYLVVCLLMLSKCVWATPESAKLYVGYQGWFNTADDGMGLGYRHYGAGYDGNPKDAKVTVEMWPDVSELSTDERFQTTFTTPDGNPAELFSSSHPKTVLTHFKWMRDYKIDGAFLQRFGVELKQDNRRRTLNQVLSNVRAASKATQVEWALMYDLSGMKKGDIASVLIPDLKQLIESGITQDPHYIHHNGKPLISIWGAGFNDDRHYTLKEISQLVKQLKESDHLGNFSVMLGVPHKWRHLNEDTVNDPFLFDLLRQADIISPWAVGRYRHLSEVDSNKQRLVEDKAWLDNNNLDYLPVIFPGFSWHNLEAVRGKASELDLIPRLGGEFLWRQAVVAKQAGANMLYVAMFDEIDEATAIFKVTNNPPIEAPFLTYKGLPSDHYLWVSSQIKALLDETLTPNQELPKRH